MKCKFSGEKIKPFMSFGKMPMANAFLKNLNKKEYFFRLQATFGNKFSLFQLVDNPKPNKMFNRHYPFYTSSSKYMVEHFKNFSSWIKKNYLKKNNYSILEIGSNDGSFLSNFDRKKSCGFEPSKSVHLVAKKNKINSINKFFNLNNRKK